jgi:hypothetical protein
MDIGQPTSFNLAPHKAGRSSELFAKVGDVMRG